SSLYFQLFLVLAGLWQCTAPPETCGTPSSHCAESEFPCRTGGRCVPMAWLCDNEDDCWDGSDEVCPLSCPPDQYRCAGGQCIPWGYRCDGTADCADHSDEKDWPPCGRYEFHCHSGECQPRGWVCDNEADCLDGSDELHCNRTCELDQFPCAHGPCSEQARPASCQSLGMADWVGVASWVGVVSLMPLPKLLAFFLSALGRPG
uniref:Uncharacterized protein n=1 Tax=Laticauda laticaudata TaxID=8630 RepID=A0A8C5S3U8_LATLA